MHYFRPTIHKSCRDFYDIRHYDDMCLSSGSLKVNETIQFGQCKIYQAQHKNSQQTFHLMH